MIEEYQMANKCYGCQSTNDLVVFTLDEFTCTLCHSCEQKVIQGILREQTISGSVVAATETAKEKTNDNLSLILKDGVINAMQKLS